MELFTEITEHEWLNDAFFCYYRIHPSQSCGPFRIYNEEKFVMFRVISDMINGFPEEVSKIFKVLGSPTVYIPITIFLW